jgi:hypothetical protein
MCVEMSGVHSSGVIFLFGVIMFSPESLISDLFMFFTWFYSCFYFLRSLNLQSLSSTVVITHH